jgi:hypothetical protein
VVRTGKIRRQREETSHQDGPDRRSFEAHSSERGLRGRSKVVLEEIFDEHPDCNWAISVIDAVDAADPIAVGPVSDEVYEEMASEFEMLTVH